MDSNTVEFQAVLSHKKEVKEIRYKGTSLRIMSAVNKP